MARQMLKEAELSSVSGGITLNNDWGDNTIFKVGKNGGPFTHTFPVSRYDEYDAIVSETYDEQLSEKQNEENIMAALIAAPGLLTPIN